LSDHRTSGLADSERRYSFRIYSLIITS